MLTGISTLVDLSVPLPRLLEQIAAAGFDCVSLCHDVGHSSYHAPAGRAELRRLLADSGLRLNYIHPPIQPYYDLTSLDPQVRRFSVELHRMVIDACAELEGLAVTAHACNEKRVPAADLAPRVEAGQRSLEELGPYAAQLSVHFCVENLPGTYGAQDVTDALLRQCERGDVYVTLDPNHAWIGCDDPRALIERLAPRVRATHISDTLGERDSHLLPGDGVVDFGQVAAALARAGFGSARGDVLDLECSIAMQRRRLRKGQPDPGDPPSLGDLPDTAEYLRRAHRAALRIATQIEAARAEAA